MLSALLLAAALAAGAPGAFVVVAAVAVWRPVWFLGLAAAWGVVARLGRHRTDPAAAEAAFLRAVAAELGAGASLRRALVDAAGAAPEPGLAAVVRAAAAGRPMAEVAGRVRPALAVNGAAAAAALRIGAATGAATAPVFNALAMRADAIAEEARERRTLTTQARLSAVLVGVVPAGFAVLLLVTRAEDFAAAGSAGVVMAVAGLVLDGAGLAAVWAMLRRAER